MATQYQVNIAMTGETVAALNANGFSLYGFRAVQSLSGGSPVVWFQTTDFALNTSITWSENYQAYTSQSEIIPNAAITADPAYPIAPGQTLTISNPSGIGEVSGSEGPGAMQQGITILNQTVYPFTCGILQQQPSGTFGPTCAFPLFADNLEMIVPMEQVFLMFSSLPLDTGTVIEQAYGPGILINLTGANTQSVSYDINQGWSWAGQASWAQSFPPNLTLVPLLVQPIAMLGPQ